eukprot:8274696-Pyramimonas_sp.AAC.1
MDVTINHLKSIRACILDPGVIELVSSCEEQMNMHYQPRRKGISARGSILGSVSVRRLEPRSLMSTTPLKTDSTSFSHKIRHQTVANATVHCSAEPLGLPDQHRRSESNKWQYMVKSPESSKGWILQGFAPDWFAGRDVPGEAYDFHDSCRAYLLTLSLRPRGCAAS